MDIRSTADYEVCRSILSASLPQYGIELELDTIQTLLDTLFLTLEHNKKVNVTAIKDPRKAVILHTLDSLLPLSLEACTLTSDDRVLDIGTGGGFPGIPLAITTPASFLLMDSVGKKTRVVQNIVDTYSLSHVRVSHRRCEDIQHDERASFTYVVTRAVARIATILEYARPYLAIGGKAVLYKAQIDREELQAVDAILPLLGFDQPESYEFDLPDSFGHRTLLIYTASNTPKLSLPRATGLAKNKPLA